MRGIAADLMVLRRPLEGGALAAARVAWLVLVVPTVALAVIGFVAGFADLTLLGPESIFIALGQAGIDPAVAVAVGLVLPILMMTVIGTVMFWKRSADPLVLLTSLMLITFTAALSRSTFAAVTSAPGLSWLARVSFCIGFGSFVLVFAIFPNGRSVPAWAWIFAPVMAIIVLGLPQLPRALAMFPDRPSDLSLGEWRISLMAILVALGSVVICQAYRYWKVSNHLERLQAKWVILPLAVAGVQILVIFILSQPVFDLGAVFAGWAQLSVIPATLMLPVGMAAAILKFRLYDIERIISRTVAYGLLTAVLFAVYAALVFLLRGLMPLQGDLAVAGSTLGVAALANPLRNRIQGAVDRRFNRSHADAARTLAEFTNTLRIAPDLQGVMAQLQSAVHQSFQPDRLTVWMRSPEARGARQL